MIFNGTDFREITPGELEEMVHSAKVASLERRNSPMTDGQVLRLLLARQVNTLDVDDNTALRMVEFYPTWAAGTGYTTGIIVNRGGNLWRCLQAHTSQPDWEPENVPSLWERVCFRYSGEESDPVPYEGNMRLENGKYYIQNEVVYKCIRDTGNPVYHALSDLIGLYVEEVFSL
jgi:hypothetical protein